MNNKLCMLLVAVLSIGFLILLSPYMVHQDLFSASENPLHTNKPVPMYIEKSRVLRSVIDDVGGISEGGALHIKISRLDNPDLDINKVHTALTFFENVVVEVDLDGEELNRSVQRNREKINKIWKSMDRNRGWDHLKSLELRHTNPGDPDKATVSTFRGSQLENVLSDPSNLVSYRDEESGESTIISSNPVPVRQSVILTLLLSPPVPTYGDVMIFSGYFSGTSGGDSTVHLYVDSRFEASGTTDENGQYSIPLELGVMPPGGHTAYTQAGGVFSDLRKFSIVSHSTTLTLGCAETEDAWLCDGSLKSGNKPVGQAEVEILVDGAVVTRVFTDESGRYSAVLPEISAGSQVQAVFRARDLALLDSQSPVIQISEGNLLFRIIVISLIILVPVGGIVYLRRRRDLPGEYGDERISQESTGISEPIELEHRNVDEVSATYHDKAEHDPSGAAFMLFRDLARRLSGRYRIKAPFSLTAREIMAALPEGDLQNIFRRFVPVYEYTRYAGRVTAENMDQLVSEWLSAVRSLMGRGGS